MKKSDGFTLVELLLVMVLVAVLTTIAAIMYPKYTASARVSEAVVGMKAVILSQKVEKMRGQYYAADSPILFRSKGIELETRFFDFSTTPNGADGFQVTATGTSNFDAPGDTIKFEKNDGQEGVWSVGESNKMITLDMISSEV